MLDAVYLQQNSFDPVDANCGTMRQRYVTDKLIEILSSRYTLQDKEDARGFFNRMRQKLLDWNYDEFESDGFRKTEEEIDALYRERDGREDPLQSILKDGEDA